MHLLSARQKGICPHLSLDRCTRSSLFSSAFESFTLGVNLPMILFGSNILMERVARVLCMCVGLLASLVVCGWGVSDVSVG